MPALQHVSLFSGIGGFELAMAEAGIPTIAACEIDKKARGVLHDRFPGVHIYHDVRKVTGDSLRSLGAVPGRTVLTAGWPCQGNSVAGSRGGMDDARSGLWSEVVRILAELRPAWFVGENVPGLLSVAGGRDFATVVGDLARLGYGFAWRVLDAQHFGVPQRRRRVVIVGRLGDSGRASAQVLLEPEGGGRNPAEGIAPRQIFARRTAEGAEGGFIPRLAKTLCANSSQSLDSDLEDFVVSAPRLASTLTAGQANPGVSVSGRQQEDDHNIVAFQCHGSNVGPMGTVRAGNGNEGGGVPFIAYVADTASTVQAMGGERGYRIDAEGAAGGHLVAFTKTQRSGARDADGNLPAEVWKQRDVSATLAPADLTSEHRAVELLTDGDAIVRRLTPLETCRLQGYPDGHTATSNGQPQADGPQYKQHGNGIAVPMFAWVAKRIAAVEDALGGAA